MTADKLIWNIVADSDNYRSFRLLDWKRIELIETLGDGKQLADSWESVNVTLYKGDDESEEILPLGDFVRFFGLAINISAFKILRPIISNTVEFLPLKCDIGSYFALNVDWIDCLDVSRSVVKRFESSGRIMRVEKYALNWERLNDVHMFHLPELRMSKLFVSDTFKQVVEANRLQGLIFYPIDQVI